MPLMLSEMKCIGYIILQTVLVCLEPCFDTKYVILIHFCDTWKFILSVATAKFKCKFFENYRIIFFEKIHFFFYAFEVAKNDTAMQKARNRIKTESGHRDT